MRLTTLISCWDEYIVTVVIGQTGCLYIFTVLVQHHCFFAAGSGKCDQCLMFCSIKFKTNKRHSFFTYCVFWPAAESSQQAQTI